MFTDIVSLPGLRRLDFGEVPRCLRHRLLDLLPAFTQLRELRVGRAGYLILNLHLTLFEQLGGAGSRVPVRGREAEQLIGALSCLPHLTRFSLKRYGSPTLLAALVAAVGSRLSSLDIEDSKQVGVPN